MEDWKVRLRQAREARGLNKTEFAKLVGVSNPTATDWEKSVADGGIKVISGVKLTKVCLELHIDANWLLYGKINRDFPWDLAALDDSYAPNLPAPDMQSNVDDAPHITGRLKKLPVVGRVQAGPDGVLSVDDYPAGFGDGYMLWWSKCPEAYVLRIRGESMSPRYLPGEFVGVDPCADVTPSDEVIVILKSGQRMIKRLLWQREDQTCFESVNKDFQNIVIEAEDIDSLHLVLGNIPKAAFRSE